MNCSGDRVCALRSPGCCAGVAVHSVTRASVTLSAPNGKESECVRMRMCFYHLFKGKPGSKVILHILTVFVFCFFLQTSFPRVIEIFAAPSNVSLLGYGFEEAETTFSFGISPRPEKCMFNKQRPTINLNYM